MEETFEGTFYFDTEKNDWCVCFVKANKKEAIIKCDTKQISPNLPRNKDEKIKVKFETDKRYYSEVLNVRLMTEEVVVDVGNMVKGDFHNPYNFVPAISRENVTDELADREPSGHDCYLGDKFSGKLTVKMKVKTPLVMIDTARIEQGLNDHKKFPVRVGADGKSYIAPTAVKGMLRSAYEAITNSRMSVFSKHEDRLAFRMESTEGAMSVPARIENGQIVLYTGTTEISEHNGKPLNEDNSLNDNKREKNATLCAAWLPFSLKVKVNNVERLPKHNEKVCAWLEKIQHYNKRTNSPDFKYWRVRKLAGSLSDLGDQPNKSSDTNFHKSLGEFIDVEGYVCNTGKNIKNKHDERLFFINGKNDSEIIKIDFDSQTHGKALEDLIKNYRKEHSEKNGDLSEPPSYEDYRGNKIYLEWSRPIQRTEFNETSNDSKLNSESVKNSPLCYVRVRNINNKWFVDELYPVTISRRLHQVSPAQLLDNTLIPAKSLSQFSPADRVFGWVGDGIKKNGSYRGQVRIGSVDLSKEYQEKPIDEIILKFGNNNNSNTWLPMNILGQPKPQQGRFYVAKNKNGDAQPEGLTNEQAGYSELTEYPNPLLENGQKVKKGLRGRKVYPHHANLPEDYWFKEKNIDFSDESKLQSGSQFREYLRPPGEKQRNNQNRSIEGWIIPQTEFEFDIHFTNLSEMELGALVWLLQLPENHFHRFGGGKSLGFGSVKLELSKYQINKGSKLIEFYKSLDNKLSEVARDENKESFEKTVQDTFMKPFTDEIEKSGYQTLIKSFLTACEGFGDKPTHYPRKGEEPNAEGKSFEWFVANSSKDGRKLTLPNLANETGLPLIPEN